MHPFFRRGLAGLPSRIASYDSIRKHAHHVWDVSNEDGVPTVYRISSETVDTIADDSTCTDIQPGQCVILFMGGSKITASVKSVDSGNATLSIDDMEMVVPVSWLHVG